MAANKIPVTFTLKELGFENLLSKAVKNLEQHQAFQKSILEGIPPPMEASMPIAIKGVSGEDLIALLNVSENDKIWLHQHQPEIHVQATQIILKLPDIEPVSITAKAENLMALKNGNLPKITKQALQMQFAAAIKKLKQASALTATPETVAIAKLDQEIIQAAKEHTNSLKEAVQAFEAASPMASPIVSATMEALLKNKKTIEPEAAAGLKWPSIDMTDLQSMPTVKLIHATKLYQPVIGTSSNSRYFLVAACSGLKVAVRFKDNSLSFRVEGINFSGMVPVLKQVGFTTILDQADTHYASMHLAINDDTLARKSLGAVLSGIGPIWETPFPNIDQLKNKGV